jgi:cytochrome P450
MRRRIDVPVYRDNLYCRGAIVDPYPHYTRLRQLGPVVWLSKQRVYALPRFAECKTVLRDDQTFISGEGVALNLFANKLSRGTTLNSDGAEHDRRRKLVAHRLLPRALRAMTDDIERQAEQIVAAAVAQTEVDGVADLARPLPLSIVPDLVGWPKDSRANLLRWGAATFDFLGPANRFFASSTVASLQMVRFSRDVVRHRSVADGSMGHDILVAADEGKLPRDECSALMVDYLVPSLDTTISGIAHALALFAMYPDQWKLLRAEPSLLPNAINEVLRFESPLRAFGRKVSQPCAIAGVDIPAGARVLVLYASANRDEREWEEPERFDITRDANRQLGFGHGAHACAGQGLARVETQALLSALMDRVERIELAGEPSWALNNIIRCYEHLPLRLISA